MTCGNSARSVPPVSATTCSTRGGNFSGGCSRSGRSDDANARGRHAEDATRRTADPGGRTHRSDAVAIPPRARARRGVPLPSARLGGEDVSCSGVTRRLRNYTLGTT